MRCGTSTLQANWLLAWEIRFRQQRDRLLIDEQGKRITNAWRIAINRIPSTKTVAECNEIVKQARREALQRWPRKVLDDGTDTESSEPVFLLPELETLRLDEVEDYGPTSIKRRGGNPTVLATKYLVRRLTLEGILGPNVEGLFPYSRRENELAHLRLQSFLEGYCGQWQPGWWSFDPHILTASASLLAVFVVHSIVWSVTREYWHEQTLLRFVLGLTSTAILGLIFYVVARVIREAIREAKAAFWFIDGCSLGSLPAKQQAKLFHAGVFTRLGFANRMFLLFILLLAMVPTASYVGLVYEHLGLMWKLGAFLTITFTLIVVLLREPGKAAIFRAMKLIFFALLGKLPRRFGTKVE